MKNTIKKTFAVLLLAAPLLAAPALTAHAQTSFTGAQISAKTSFQNQNSNGVVINSLSTSNKNNALYVQAQVQNTGSKNLHLYYRLLWLNTEGVQVGNSTWKPVLLMPNKAQAISESAPTTDAVDFKLELNAE